MDQTNNAENRRDRIRMTDSELDRVGGGTSLYEEADGKDRESWFVNLVSKLINREEDKTKQNS